ncbi:MAG: sodium:proton antiporter [Gammaproteobacteria bacterium]|nr:sodium:proton antiporter [Gammaproteobacteria bacterium]MBU1624457.1 sodium:proton antiporter [Gammaproteobacteria bacterium]MBU1981185.1 sodium:proton antiporter [Gammaproteobacteria bacterium]
MIKRFLALSLLVGIGAIFVALMMSYEPDASLNLTARYYAENTASETGSANIVTAILVTYRGLDTLGEVTVLFLASSIIGLVLSLGNKQNTTLRKLVPVGELLTTGKSYLAPIIMLLGVYVFVNGHLTPGGGFQGGAIIASGMLLLLLSDPLKHFSHALISLVESLSGFVYVSLGVLGIVLAGSFLDNRILPLGDFGDLISAGAIPLIYSLIGLKVGAEFSSMLANLSEMEDLQ